MSPDCGCVLCTCTGHAYITFMFWGVSECDGASRSDVILSGVIVAMQLPSGQNLDLEFVKLTAGKTDRFYEDVKPTHREEHLLSVSAAQQVFSHNGLKATGNVPSKVEEKEKDH
ncbi:hypothetical protein ACER0C_002796 [Sarotherodon galilaeus]